jgi:hypothetical protein
MKNYLVRDNNGELFVYSTESGLKPVRDKNFVGTKVWVQNKEDEDNGHYDWFDVSRVLCNADSISASLKFEIPDITWKDEPIEIESIEMTIKITAKK